jgi:hypothetical protein
MSRSNTWICDRCGVTSEKSPRGWTSVGLPWNYVDLCRCCRDGLKRWFKNPKDGESTAM